VGKGWKKKKSGTSGGTIRREKRMEAAVLKSSLLNKKEGKEEGKNFATGLQHRGKRKKK